VGRGSLALSRDPLHVEAREQWSLLHHARAKLHTSVPVVIETFTFLDRNANRDVALAWRESIYSRGMATILPCELEDLRRTWEYFRRTDLHALGGGRNELCDREARANQARIGV
jgi:hypothetical protein